MAKYRIMLNRAHPTGSMNMRDAEDRTITVTNNEWTEVDEISQSMRDRAKWLIVSEVEQKSEKKAEGKTKSQAASAKK